MRSAPDALHLPWPGLYLFGSFAAAGLGGLSTARAIPTWYRTLRKPGWNPPDAVFGPVWTVLYASMAVAAWLVRRGMSNPSRTTTGAAARFAAGRRTARAPCVVDGVRVGTELSHLATQPVVRPE